jgi:hypothetical protein
MKILKSILRELKTIFKTALFFAIAFLLMMVIKKLDLKDYDIEFTGISQALIGALIMSKVIILMGMISLGPWVQRQPPIIDIILRKILYSIGVVIIVILEKGFEGSHKHGGFSNAVSYLISHRDIYHVWATTIGVSVSIFIYNCYIMIQRKLGKNGMSKLFFSTPLNQLEKLHVSKS